MKTPEELQQIVERLIDTWENEVIEFKQAGKDYKTDKIGKYFSGEKTPGRYRNSFLAQAMTELNMIDTMGYGIRDMHIGQDKRYFPLPDYDLTNSDKVQVILYGKIVDPAYTRMLIQSTDLPLVDVLALDRIQKKLPVDGDVVKRLRKFGMVEGRKPNLHIAAEVAKVTGDKAAYIKNRGKITPFTKASLLTICSSLGRLTDRILMSCSGLNCQTR